MGAPRSRFGRTLRAPLARRTHPRIGMRTSSSQANAVWHGTGGGGSPNAGGNVPRSVSNHRPATRSEHHPKPQWGAVAMAPNPLEGQPLRTKRIQGGTSATNDNPKKHAPWRCRPQLPTGPKKPGRPRPALHPHKGQEHNANVYGLWNTVQSSEPPWRASDEQ